MSTSNCIPVFPPCPKFPKRKRHLVQDSAFPLDDTTLQAGPDYIQRLAQQSERLSRLPLELCPPSRPTSPGTVERSLELQEKIVNAVLDTDANPSHPKWGHVTRMVRMAATSRRQGAAPGVKVGEKVKLEVGDYKFVVPGTEAEWEECERKWVARKLSGKPGDEAEKRRGKRKGGEKGKVSESRFFKTPAAGSTEGKVGGRPKRSGLVETKEERIRRKVQSWRNSVIHEDPLHKPDVLHGVEETKPNEKQMTKDKRQSPLELPVAIHVTPTAKKPNDEGGDPRPTGVDPSDSPMDVRMLSPERPLTLPTLPQVPAQNSSPPKISDVSEASFLPPSFPTHLETSTPRDADKVKLSSPHAKRKPLPIHTRPFLSSQPTPPLSNSSPFNPRHPTRRSPASLAGSPNPPDILPTTREVVDPGIRPLKRPRPSPPPSDDVFMTGAIKKPRRTSPQLDPTNPNTTNSSAPPPLTSPLLMMTPPLPAPIHASPPQTKVLVRTESGLGNAKGLPVPETPERKDLPTLTDLLATSRRSRPRPRPPSRKPKQGASNDLRTAEIPGMLFVKDQGHDLQSDKGKGKQRAGQADAIDISMEDSNAASATTPASHPKVYFSSPASVSESSQPAPQSLFRPIRSPVSPFFRTGNLSNPDISRFSPPYTSTQQQQHQGHQGHHRIHQQQPHTRSTLVSKQMFGAVGGGSSQNHQFLTHSLAPGLSSGRGLTRGGVGGGGTGSGIFGMYNSQFDVEAQVGQVTELLERDVDFDEYLKDVDEIEMEEV